MKKLITLVSILLASTIWSNAQTLTCWTGGNWNKPTPTDIYKIPTISTINIAAYASFCNPSEGRYNWSVIDEDLANCVRYHKSAIVSVVLNSKCPEWFKNNMPDSTPYFIDVRGQGKIFEATIPIPYNDTYITYCTGFIKALADHLKLNSTQYNLITGVGFGAIGNSTLEIKLPNDSVNPLSTNAIKVWTDYGYSSKRIIKTFNVIRNCYMENFAPREGYPIKNIIIDVISPDEMPIVNGDTTNVVLEMLRICGSTSNPSRWQFKYTSLTPMYNGKMTNLIQSYGLKAIIQTNPLVFGGFCATLPCDPTGFNQAIRLAKFYGVIQIELQIAVINNYKAQVLNYK
jgi:hypothetical protein